jgi:superfamily II DNA helicase RecQ
VRLPKIQLILATKSAEAGINGKFLKHGKVSGFPSSIYELVQQLGRLDRGGTDPAGSNAYEVHVDFYSYISLFVCILQQNNVGRRKLELKQLQEVVRLLSLPAACYHTGIEKYFEWRDFDRTDCMRFCSHCLGEVKHFTKRVNRDGLISLLSTKTNTSNAGLTVSEFMKVLKTSKDLTVHNDDIPKINQMSQLHAVALQLLGAGTVKLMVSDKKKLEQNKVLSADIASKVCVKDIERNGQCYGTPCCMIDECWTGINVHNFD